MFDRRNEQKTQVNREQRALFAQISSSKTRLSGQRLRLWVDNEIVPYRKSNSDHDYCEYIDHHSWIVSVRGGR